MSRDGFAEFLRSPTARGLSLEGIGAMSEDEIETIFALIRWPETEGAPICPRCGALKAYRYETRKLWTCKACAHQFSVTSGTIFASRKMSLRAYLAIIIELLSGKGRSALEISKRFGISYKSVFNLVTNVRSALHAGFWDGLCPRHAGLAAAARHGDADGVIFEKRACINL
jgi:transposase-like protein